MRRSRRISTLLVGSACMLTLVACGDDEQDNIKIYTDFASCAAENDKDVCAKEFAEAEKKHIETAPRYAQQQSCEELYGAGNCRSVPMRDASGNSTNWFMPALAGFMLARAIGQPYPQPIYRDNYGFAYSGGTVYGDYRSSSSGRTATVSRSKSSPATAARPSASSRGGFGSTSSRSSFSSGS